MVDLGNFSKKECLSIITGCVLHLFYFILFYWLEGHGYLNILSLSKYCGLAECFRLNWGVILVLQMSVCFGPFTWVFQAASLTWVLGHKDVLTACSSAQNQNHPQKLSWGKIWRLVFLCCFCIVPGDLLSPLPKFSTCTCSSYAIGLTFYTWLIILTSELVST